MKKKSNIVSELKKDRGYTEIQNKIIIKKMVQDCVCIIKNFNQNGVTNYIYSVPPFMIGYPIYDLTEISNSVLSSLKKMGFTVMFIPPNKIYISW